MDTDIELVRQQLAGLDSQLKALKAAESTLAASAGMETQIAKSREELKKIEIDIENAKEQIEELSARQSEMLRGIVKNFEDRISENLPSGRAVINIGEDRVAIGWEINGSVHAYRALSGGEKTAFDMACAAALNATLIIKEAAEMDRERLRLAMEAMKNASPQVVLLTCQDIPQDEAIEGWEKLYL